jgi:hypothetical protein
MVNPKTRTKRTRTPAQKKGDALEDAVRILESAILKLSPGYSEKTFHIVPKKIICVDGVHHELDIWISVDIGVGYSATFIFECRNWKKKTDKDDVIVFSEKIAAAQAQGGFFVAKGFTRDAVAKAKSDPRIRLLRVSEVDFSDVPTALAYFHAIEQTGSTVNCNVKIKTGKETGESVPLELETAVFILNGQVCELGKYVKEWQNDIFDREQRRFRSEKVPAGPYSFPFEEVRQFSDADALINGEIVERITMSGTVELRVWRGELESRFEVESRGRVFRSVVRMPYGELIITGHELAVARLSESIHPTME